MERPANGAFVDALLLGDLGNGQLSEIVGVQRFPLPLGQLRFDDPADPPQLDFPGQPGALVAVKECISRCGGTPFRSSGR